MSTSLSSLVDNLSEIYNKKCIDKNCKSEREFIELKNNRLQYKCYKCTKIQLKPINEVIKKIPNKYRFCNKDISKFILLLRKGVYPYEYMDSWKYSMKQPFQIKKFFYSELNLEDIADIDYAHAQKVFKEFKSKNLVDYYDLYVQGDTLLLADIFENFRNKCIEIYELEPAHFLSVPGLAWEACLKKTWAKLELLTNIDMLLRIVKGIQGGIFHGVHRYAKANNKYIKKYDKDIERSSAEYNSIECNSFESSYLIYLDPNNLYGWAMSQKLPANGFQWEENIHKCNEDFIKDYDYIKGYFFEVDVEYPRNIFNLHSDLPFVPEINKIKICNKLLYNIHDKENYVAHIRALIQAIKHGLIFKKKYIK